MGEPAGECRWAYTYRIADVDQGRITIGQQRFFDGVEAEKSIAVGGGLGEERHGEVVQPVSFPSRPAGSGAV